MHKKVNLLGTPIDNITMEKTIFSIENFIREGIAKSVLIPNVDCLIKLLNDSDFKEAYDHCDLVLPDGHPLLWAGRFLGTPFKEKVPGSDLLPRFCEVSAEKGYRLFFLGAGPGVAQKAAEILQKKNPGLQVVGTYSPPYGFENDERENQKIVKMIREARPDVLFVALGAPKQEKWIYKYKDQYQVPVSIGVGASFDFVAGKVKRAPRWMTDHGLEWLWRMIQEPKRLWKRYLIDDIPFFYFILKQKLGFFKDSFNLDK